MTELEMLMVEAQSAPDVDLHDALAVLVNRRVQREQEIERARKHAEILPLCREARARLERLKSIELPAAAARVEESRQAVDHANKRLWAHQGNRPGADAYPADAELAAYDELTQILASEAAEAREEKIAAETEHASLTQAYLLASDEFAKLQRVEASLRPKVEEPRRPNASSFSLDAVR